MADVRPSVVYHCAGAAHVGQAFSNIADTFAANVMGTHHVLDALKVAGLRARVLITGSSLVYRHSDGPLREDDPTGPATPYAVSKLAQEMLGLRGIREDRQEVLLTRPFNHTGPRQDPTYAAPTFAHQIALIEKGRMRPEIVVGNLDASRDLHDVRDTVRAYATIVGAGEPGRVYNVCSGQAFRIRDVLDRLVAMSKVPVTVTRRSRTLSSERQPDALGRPHAHRAASLGGSPKSRSIRPWPTSLITGERKWRRRI